MSEDGIRELLLHPERMTKETLEGLRGIVSASPCFHAARILMLQNMSVIGDEEFGQELQRARFFLPCGDNLSEIIDEAVSRRNSGMLSNDRTMTILNEFLGTPTDSDSMGGQTFFSPIQTDYLVAAGLDDKTDGTVGDTDDAIDSFIDTFLKDGRQCDDAGEVPAPDPQTEPAAEENGGEADGEITYADTKEDAGETVTETVDDSTTGITDSNLDNELFTETLAAIYIKQRRYVEALEIIRYLYLNFPNKSCYFADQIRFLELIIETNKQKG